MNAGNCRAAVLSALLVTATIAGVWAGPLSGQTLQKQPRRDAGADVTGAFEGWFRNADGTFSLLLGYFNRNQKEELDVPIGPNNHIDPGGPDRGQPTHFLTGRQHGLFAVKVPADFGKSKITWTLVANGQTTTIPASLHVDYEISPFVSTASAVDTPGQGDTPPVLRFEEHGASAQGPQGLTTERTATLGDPLTLTVWVADDGKIFTNSGAVPKNFRAPLTVTWTKYRGPGAVTFTPGRPEVQNGDHPEKGMAISGTATTTATFSEAGDYVAHVTVNDYSGPGGGGFQCCWTYGDVKVTVKPR
jgi:hypothetical protein